MTITTIAFTSIVILMLLQLINGFTYWKKNKKYNKEMEFLLEKHKKEEKSPLQQLIDANIKVWLLFNVLVDHFNALCHTQYAFIIEGSLEEDYLECFEVKNELSGTGAILINDHPNLINMIKDPTLNFKEFNVKHFVNWGEHYQTILNKKLKNKNGNTL